MAAGISVAIIAILNTLSGQLKNAFSNMTDVLKSAGNALMPDARGR